MKKGAPVKVWDNPGGVKYNLWRYQKPYVELR
jgi:hypothetical protein